MELRSALNAQGFVLCQKSAQSNAFCRRWASLPKRKDKFRGGCTWLFSLGKGHIVIIHRDEMSWWFNWVARALCKNMVSDSSKYTGFRCMLGLFVSLRCRWRVYTKFHSHLALRAGELKASTMQAATWVNFTLYRKVSFKTIISKIREIMLLWKWW